MRPQLLCASKDHTATSLTTDQHHWHPMLVLTPQTHLVVEDILANLMDDILASPQCQDNLPESVCRGGERYDLVDHLRMFPQPEVFCCCVFFVKRDISYQT